MSLDAKVLKLANFMPNGDQRTIINYQSDMEFLPDFLVHVAKDRVVAGTLPELENISKKLALNGRWATYGIPIGKSAGYYTKMVFGMLIKIG